MNRMYVIHRQCDKEREPLVNNLQVVFPTLTVFEGIDGSTLHIGKCHPWEGETTDGNLGNTASHVSIVQLALEKGLETVTLFEDDAVVLGDILYKKPVDCDIWYWGVNEVVEGKKEEDWIRIGRAWGSHAVSLNRKAMMAVIAVYKKSIHDQIGLPADWLYNCAIRHYGLKAYCPIVNVISQKEGLISLATGNIR